MPAKVIRSVLKKDNSLAARAASPVRMAREREVNLERLKQFAIENLSKKSTLRDILLSEANRVGARDFLAKMELWLKLLSLEGKMD
jgi:hypothetical protein